MRLTRRRPVPRVRGRGSVDAGGVPKLALVHRVDCDEVQDRRHQGRAADPGVHQARGSHYSSRADKELVEYTAARVQLGRRPDLPGPPESVPERDPGQRQGHRPGRRASLHNPHPLSEGHHHQLRQPAPRREQGGRNRRSRVPGTQHTELPDADRHLRACIGPAGDYQHRTERATSPSRWSSRERTIWTRTAAAS